MIRDVDYVDLDNHQVDLFFLFLFERPTMFIKACSYLNKGTPANRSIRSVARIVKYTKTILLLLPLRLKKIDG